MREYYKTMDHRMNDFQPFYARIASELPDNAVLAEVGVADGASVIFLAETLLNLGKTFTLYAVDNLEYGRHEQLWTILQHVGEANLGQWIKVLPIDSLNTCVRFPDDHFDFVFLDSSHRYEPTKAEIREWYRKIKENGILAGHDYNEGEGKEVYDAVNVVVPKIVVRQPDSNRQYEAEQVLQIENTEQGHGVWWLKRKWYVKLN